MKRREFLKTSALTAGAMTITGKNLHAAQGRPNVLLIICDQWREPRWFPEKVNLPGYERLCKEGLNFTNHFASAVPCSPSRACLFTGMHLTQHGVESNVDPTTGHASLDPRIPTLGHRFKEAGYRTPYLGKWHLSQDKDYADKGLAAYGYEGWHGPDHDGIPYDGLEHDGLFAEQSIRWLRQHGKKGPFFLTCSLINPHDICYYRRLDVPDAFVPDVFSKLPDNHEDDLKTKPRIQALYREAYGKGMGTTPDQPRPVWLHYLDFYYWLQQKVDHHVSRLLATLDQLGLAENTIVLFTADHGDMCGSHKLQAKGPFMYQENNNVPFIVRWPGKIQAGVQTKALSQNPDVFPTLMELAGISAPLDHLPGKSLAPVILQPGKPSPDDHILIGFGMRLLAHAGQSHSDYKGVPIQFRAIHDGRYKYARYFDPGCQEEYELYDLQNDPGELRNLAIDSGYLNLRKELADRLAEAEPKEMAPVPKEMLRKI